MLSEVGTVVIAANAKAPIMIMIPSMRNRLMARRGIGWRVARIGLVASLTLSIIAVALILFSFMSVS